MYNRKNVLFIAFIVLYLSGLAQTKRINFTSPKLYPEGTAYDEKNDKYFVSSVKTGTIGTVDEKGTYTALYIDNGLKSSFGIKTDKKKNKIWVCTGDPNYSSFTDSVTAKKMIRLVGIDIASGKKTDDIDLSNIFNGKHFLNDLTLDDSGNIYLTDSYSPVIYKVDSNGKASVFAFSELFKGKDVGLNGIVWSPKGFLITGNGSTGSIIRIDVDDPQKIAKVKIPVFFPGADGLLWDAKGNLVLIQNKGVNKVFQLSSKDDWKTAEITGATAATDRFIQPSTGTMALGKIYVLNSKINELNDPTAPPSNEFSLQEVIFKPVK